MSDIKNPLHNKKADDEDYLSQLDETSLREYVAIAKLNMLRLDNPQHFTQILLTNQYTKTRNQTSNIRWILAFAALLFMVIPYLIYQFRKS